MDYVSKTFLHLNPQMSFSIFFSKHYNGLYFSTLKDLKYVKIDLGIRGAIRILLRQSQRYSVDHIKKKL